VIPRWDGKDGFQHYRDRDPIWIKNYRTLLTNNEYRGLSHHQRGILHALWLAYATSNRQLSDSTLTLTRLLGQRVLRRDLDALNHAGFIQFSASRPLARRYHDASTEDIDLEERPKPISTSNGSVRTHVEHDPEKPAARIWCCMFCPVRFVTRSEVETHLAAVHWDSSEFPEFVGALRFADEQAAA